MQASIFVVGDMVIQQLVCRTQFKPLKFGPIINYLLACVGCTGECAKFWKSLNRLCWAWSVLPQPQANIPQYSPHALFI